MSLHISSLRQSHPDHEGVLRVSKCLKHQILIDEREIESLFSQLENPLIYVVSEPVTLDGASISKEHFLQKWSHYIEALRNGTLPEEQELRRYFSTIFTKTSDILYAMKVGPEKYLIKPLKPVIQLQLHHFFYSTVDTKFHPMVLGKDSVTWGIQFSYPQIYQHPKRHDFSKVVDSPDFPNTSLFSRLAKWIRAHTVPTPFTVNGKRTNVPIRIGKNCLSWIHLHPQLVQKGLEICR
ncbi:MAG TPA: hypothetical protein VLG49_01815 [Rhabdochlamydiaceae bacterium]|nr:hypothetical protein [Rhabdochlamydiaceae bacterium]